MTYAEFVASRAKPGADILSSLNPDKAHLAHMIIGLAGEFMETSQARTMSDEWEELGDVYFYFQGICNTLKYTPNTISTSVSMLDAVQDVVDILKKHIFYNKPLVVEKICLALDKLHSIIKDKSDILGEGLWDLCESNMMKLTKRYPTEYSDAAAQARADKA